MVKNLPANAGDTGLIPGPGRFHVLGSPSARAPRPLSLCSRAQEPQLPEARARQQERPPQRETHALQLRNLHGSGGPAQPKWADATKFTYVYISYNIRTRERGGHGSPLQCSCRETPTDREPGGLQSLGSQRVRHE